MTTHEPELRRADGYTEADVAGRCTCRGLPDPEQDIDCPLHGLTQAEAPTSVVDPERVIEWAATQGFTLQPWQADVIRSVYSADGRLVVRGRRNGLETVRQILRGYHERPSAELPECVHAAPSVGIDQHAVSNCRRDWCGREPGFQGVSPDDWAKANPPLVPQTVDNLLAEIEASPVVELTTQEELLTALDELLDNALHSDECYVDPDNTTCLCVIGKVRAALPRCEVHQLTTFGPPWQCQRTAHPASPDRHVFGEV